MVGVSSLLTPRRVFLAFAVLLIAIGVAGRFAVAAESQGPSASFTFDPGAPLSGDQIIVHLHVERTTGHRQSGVELRRRRGRERRRACSTRTRFRACTRCGITVTDDESLTATHTEDVTVGNRNPSADFHHSPAAPEVGQTVTFTSDATDPEDRIGVQRWDLDDDGSYDATGAQRCPRSSCRGGSHTVTLLVEDQDGGTDTISKTIDVIDPPNQLADPGIQLHADRSRWCSTT